MLSPGARLGAHTRVQAARRWLSRLLNCCPELPPAPRGRLCALRQPDGGSVTFGQIEVR